LAATVAFHTAAVAMADYQTPEKKAFHQGRGCQSNFFQNNFRHRTVCRFRAMQRNSKLKKIEQNLFFNKHVHLFTSFSVTNLNGQRHCGKRTTDGEKRVMNFHT
jgi:hypothetical protein